MGLKEEVIDTTLSLCPYCLRQLEAEIIKKEGKVFLKRDCPEHGRYETLLSKYPDYFAQLREYYFHLVKEPFPQSRYLLYLTPCCNLNCPICFIDPHSGEKEDIYLSELKTIIAPNRELILFGAEPSCREDIFEIITYLKKHQNSVSFYTNGINIVDFRYLLRLKEAGVDKIYFQFDGFREDIYELLRGAKLLHLKIKALENLERLKLPVVLDVTIVKGINESEIGKIFDYALTHSFVRAICLVAYVRSGCGRYFLTERGIMPD